MKVNASTKGLLDRLFKEGPWVDHDYLPVVYCKFCHREAPKHEDYCVWHKAERSWRRSR